MPLKDRERRRVYHRNYLRERYQKDPAYRQRHQDIARISDAKRKRETAAVIATFKSNGCALCVEREQCCLQAHHLNPGSKDFDIGDRGKMSAARVARELAKCICLCASCHIKLHAGLVVLPVPSTNAAA